MYIDTHAHLTIDEPRFPNRGEYPDLQDVLDRAKKARVFAIINPSFDYESSLSVSCLSDDVDFVYGAIGIHPHDADNLTDEILRKFKKIAKENKKIVAIGETGLDYFKCKVAPYVQQESFKRHMDLALELNLPVIVHCREAHNDIIKIMSEKKYEEIKCVFHCFAGAKELLAFAINKGFYISYTGNITFKKADLLRESVKNTPLNRLMIETDSPYLAPEPFRGQRNEPAFVAYVAKAIGALIERTEEEVAAVTTDNAKLFFGIQ
ncbi:hypothetical protein A2230_08035 [candidate division WOR-1 bacterium RIFOXYA2_FULL_36_21]|uniref:Hydrolase TatD n=1 Tax=candidate division WOR-1 bacterium RIFOXYB2_FULL_36_35 TaxID=1802578 RepID=A0A1F4S4F5_UNCSA|nr:MAG: hypothetical protein A2230_08035 [candidate division WOR-1 bacterium RIFOXYA2_FULL_36_21]OGC14312.1 MAG: hypothetical protein A2282_00115 [candidate division WOR-1 bacterium RIFOXYA12_FULL_36_13]OGC15311.1 MAG: hypothetical protein A2290_05130 [candidate division WOR-1 bacterium RIFOXYB2_FULL_36_35]